jgi:hypothetical protein
MKQKNINILKARKSQHDDKKKGLGQFFTSKKSWLTPCIEDFMDRQPHRIVVDPFAGRGDILECFPNWEQIGYDIDSSLGKWTQNDSLKEIPKLDALCATNPPYLAKNIARYLKLTEPLGYFENSKFDNLYLIALERCLNTYDYVVAIIPETFLSQKYHKERLILVNVLQENPFDDTDFAVIVACWGPEKTSRIEIYKHDEYLATWQQLQDCIPNENVSALDVKFNVPDGSLGLIGIDPINKGYIRFCAGDEIKPDKIKVSSRHRTRIQVRYQGQEVDDINWLIEVCNNKLNELREITHDLVLAPTKGNKKDGARRRRLDFNIAKRIIRYVIKTAQFCPTTP